MSMLSLIGKRFRRKNLNRTLFKRYHIKMGPKLELIIFQSKSWVT